MFVDVVEIEISSGNGGNGLVAFRREKYVENGMKRGKLICPVLLSLTVVNFVSCVVSEM